MSLLFTIRKPFTDYIFDKTKLLEFKNYIGKKVNIGDKIYIYESKYKNGSGMVIGTVEIEDIISLTYHKVGTYNMLSYYVDFFGTKEEQEIVKKAMKISLYSCDESIVLNYLYDEWMIDQMLETHKVPDVWENPFTYRMSVSDYNIIYKKSNELCKKCDDWLRKIGYYNKYETTNWKYAIKLKNPIKFKEEKKIEMFQKQNGEFLKRAPQSWCYIK